MFHSAIETRLRWRNPLFCLVIAVLSLVFIVCNSSLSLLLGSFGFYGLLSFIFLFGLVSVVSAGRSTQDVQRINYGILFERSKNVYLSTEYWTHSFQIPLPHKVDLQPLTKCASQHCKRAAHVINSLNSLRTECVASLNATINRIHRLVPHVNIPENEKLPHISFSRTKRGLFDFIGDISKSLFGTATTSDLQTLQRHMRLLNKKNANLAKAIAKQDSHLSSFISTVDKRFNNVMSAIKQNHDDALMLARQSQSSIDEAEHEMLLLDELILKQVNVTSHLQTALDHVTLGIHDLIKGQLSPFSHYT